MNKADVISQLDSLISEGEEILNTNHFIDGVIGGPYVNSDSYMPWRERASLLLHTVMPEHQIDALKKLEGKTSNHTSLAREWQSKLKAAKEAINGGLIALDDSEEKRPSDEVTARILNRFSNAAASLTRRHNGRGGLVVEDEYDVQDLLRSLFLAYFDDVRDEECVPSFAGKNSRVDLYLKDEKRFIEVKMTREGLKDKKLGEELSVDIPQYKSHPGCEKLYCFIYDPRRYIANASGLKHDLESIDPDFVEVIIAR